MITVACAGSRTPQGFGGYSLLREMCIRWECTYTLLKYFQMYLAPLLVVSAQYRLRLNSCIFDRHFACHGKPILNIMSHANDS